MCGILKGLKHELSIQSNDSSGKQNSLDCMNNRRSKPGAQASNLDVVLCRRSQQEIDIISTNNIQNKKEGFDFKDSFSKEKQNIMGSWSGVFETAFLINCPIVKTKDIDVTDQRHKSKITTSKGTRDQQQKRGDKYKHGNRQENNIEY